MQGLIAGGQVAFPGGFAATALPGGCIFLGGGADGGQAGVPGSGAGLAEFIAGPPGRLGGLDRVRVAQGPVCTVRPWAV